MSSFDWEKFVNAVEFLKSGVNELLWRDVIFAATGKKILGFDKQSIELLGILNKWIDKNFEEIKELGLNYNKRINEFGNYIEEKVIHMFSSEICFLKTPSNIKGIQQKSGYPDFLLENNKTKIYGDCKVYKEGSETSSFRSFYYQPTESGKVLFDAPHFILMFKRKDSGNSPPFEIIDYKILDLHDLKMDFKAEFQASNRDTLILSEIF